MVCFVLYRIISIKTGTANYWNINELTENNERYF